LTVSNDLTVPKYFMAEFLCWRAPEMAPCR